MSNGTEIAGLPVRAEPPGLVTPLAAVAMIKGLNSDGEVGYWQVRTGGVHYIEAIGMHEAAADMYKRRLP